MSCPEAINAVDHGSDSPRPFKAAIVFPPTYLMERRDQIGKPIALHRHEGSPAKRPFRNWLSGVQLLQQRLRLLQIARVEPSVNQP